MSATDTRTAEPGRASRSSDGSARTDRRERAVRIGSWTAVVLVGLLLASLTAAVGSGGRPDATPLDPSSTAASGSRALVRVLEDQGTTVDVVRGADTLDRDLSDGTVLVDDSAGVLSTAAARRIARTAPEVVLVTTDPRVLEAFGVDAEPAGDAVGGGVVATTSCAVPAARAARSVTTDGVTYDTDDPRVARCAPTGDGDDRRWGLLRTDTTAGQVTVVGTTAALRNDSVTRAGNAALALGLLGGDDRLVWYVPTADGRDAAATLGSLAPPWVPSAIGLLGVVAVAAAVWRGRRLGPLVVEQLPVVVRAAETTEGRARLAARVRDRTHTLDTLRVAALLRTGRSLGLPRSAPVDAVVRRAAAVTGRSAAQVGAVLVGGPVDGDRALVDGAAALDELEHAVRRAVSGEPSRASRPGRPPGRPPGPPPAPTTEPRPGGRP